MPLEPGGIAEKIVLGEQLEIIFHNPIIVAKQALRAAFHTDVAAFLCGHA